MPKWYSNERKSIYSKIFEHIKIYYYALKTLGKCDAKILSPEETVNKILKEKKTPIIVLTSIGDNRLSHYANYILNIGSREKIFTKIAPFASQTSIEYILNVIFSCLFKKDYQTNIQNKISYDKENDVRHPLHSPVNDIID